MNIWLRYCKYLTAIVVGALLLAACAEPQKYKIGVSQCSDDDWRSKMNEEIHREAMLHNNIEVEIRSADDSSDKQIADLDYFVQAGCDVIIVAPNEAEALSPKIHEIYASGTPVVVFDRTIIGDSYTAFQGADNAEIGRMAAQLAGVYAAQPQVLEIQGLQGSSPAELRHQGFRQVADSLGYRVLATAFANWNHDEGREATDRLLDQYPQANVIYCHNDRMALGASEAARARGRHDIKIIGVDAVPDMGIQAVKDGKIDATFLYPTNGYQLIRTALAILEHQPYERNLILPIAAPVDGANAGMLLLQDQALREETSKISVLQDKMDLYSERYSKQTYALYATVAMLAMVAITLFMLLRSYWSGKRHRRQIEESNRELARQRDELDNLYHQLQEATGSKLTFFTNVSHDLRTPLTLIADPVDQLAHADNLTPKQHTLMQLASKNIKRLQRLINQILDIRKYDNGQLRLNQININIGLAIREWLAPFAEMAAKRHIKFCSDIPVKPGIITAVDVEKTERILFNLLSNAFKFTPENGTITVTLSSEGNEAVIRVADTGIGIPAEDIKNIFERFFRTDSINPNGSGIGLALSKVFIDMQEGTIGVESQPGAGTTFTVRLPIRLVDEKEAAAVPLPVSDIAEIAQIDDDDVEVADDAQTILVVDDNPDICTLLHNVLADDYAVIVAHSGAQALRMATRYIPDLIVCDVMMPGMDGYHVCQALKREPLTSHIPVLLLTACSRDEQRIEGYEYGADAYMSKPFESAMLLARIRSLLENRRLIYQKSDDKPLAKADDKKATAKTGTPFEDEFLSRFVTVVESEMANSELSVEAIADRLGLSRVQMYRKVKALTNYSASEMIRNIRLKHAATLLKTSATTVAEVAYSVGFSSPSYFSRCYKEYFNETPADTQSRTSKAK